jgi:hypothetical protein
MAGRGLSPPSSCVRQVQQKEIEDWWLGGEEIAHENAHGAHQPAKCVVPGIRDNHLPLAQDIADDFKGFDPAHPDAPADFAVPPSPQSPTERPRGN